PSIRLLLSRYPRGDATYARLLLPLTHVFHLAHLAPYSLSSKAVPFDAAFARHIERYIHATHAALSFSLVKNYSDTPLQPMTALYSSSTEGIVCSKSINYYIYEILY